MNSKGRVAVAALILLGACGNGGSGISKSAGALLQTEVATLRAAAARGDSQTAAADLAQLRASVFQLRAGGLLSAAATARILSAAQTVQTQLVALSPPTTTTTTAPTTTTTTTSPTTTTTTTTTTTPSRDKHRNRDGHNQGGDQQSQN